MPPPIRNIAITPPKPVKVDLKPPAEQKPQAEQFDQHLKTAARKDEPIEEPTATKKKPSASKTNKPGKPNKTGKNLKSGDDAAEPAPEEIDHVDSVALPEVSQPAAAPSATTLSEQPERPPSEGEQADQPHVNPAGVPQLALAAQPLIPAQSADQLISDEESTGNTAPPVPVTQAAVAMPDTRASNQPAIPRNDSAPANIPATSEAPAHSAQNVSPLINDQPPVNPTSQSKSVDGPTATSPQIPADEIGSIESLDTDKSIAPPVEKSLFTESLDRAAADVQSTRPQSDPIAPRTVAPSPTPELQFARDNHDQIVQNVRTQLLPHGGSMHIRLDPPELGALQVMVEMRDGVMNATFQTTNEEATRLLSHSLNQLKHVLESSGVSVERLQVQQAPKNESSNAGDEHKQQQQNWSDDHTARQEQQRKELMRRMWRKVSGAGDPLDLTA